MSRMGTSTSKQNSHMSNTIQAIGPEEQKLVDRMSALGIDQADAIKFVMDQAKGGGQVSSLQLSPSDQAALNESYSGAEQNLRRFGNIMGQDLAGTRGLNTSDTPVSEAVLRETLPAYQQLMSAKAQQGLGLGLNMRQINEGARQFNLQALLGGATSTPSALGFNLGRMQADRMANSSQTGFMSGEQQGSILDQMNQGAQFRYTMHAGTNQASQAGMNGMKMMGGMG